VQESLAFGVPCIASKAGAIPEVGGDLAVYVDPTDDAQVSAAIDRYLTDPAALAAAPRSRSTAAAKKTSFNTRSSPPAITAERTRVAA